MRISPWSVHAAAVVTSVMLAAAPGLVHAQQRFPSKPIRIVASTTPGGQPDTIARMIAQKMSEHWAQAVVVDNRPGGGGAIAGNLVAKAVPDGHTIMYALPNFTISAVMQPKLSYDPLKDFATVSHVGTGTNVLVAAPALGVKTSADFIALAKSHPGKYIFPSSPTGSAAHLSGARFNYITGIKAVHVAYKGGPDAMIEVLAGRAHYHVGTMSVLLPFIKEGKLVALGVTSMQRAPVLPDVPALGETLADFARPETSHGIVAPASTPRAIVNQLSKEVGRILDLPDVKERLQSFSFVPSPGTPEEYDKILRGQMEVLSKLVREAGLQAK